MVKLFLYSVNDERVCAGEFDSVKGARMFWERFQKTWPRYDIEEMDTHEEPEKVESRELTLC